MKTQTSPTSTLLPPSFNPSATGRKFGAYLLAWTCAAFALLQSTELKAQPDSPYDLVVYGATPSGIVASLAAAREGAKVLLIEPGKHIGGMVTGGSPEPITETTK